MAGINAVTGMNGCDRYKRGDRCNAVTDLNAGTDINTVTGINGGGRYKQR